MVIIVTSSKRVVRDISYDWVDPIVLGIVSSFVCKGLFYQALVDVGPAINKVCFPQTKIIGYATDMLDELSFSMNECSSS